MHEVNQYNSIVQSWVEDTGHHGDSNVNNFRNVL